MADEDRLRAVANAFSHELRRYGLHTLQLQIERADAEGWWSPVAEWARNRPRVGVFFDKLLGGDVRHFWFGFYSTPRKIKKLSNDYSPKVEYLTDNDFLDGRLRDNMRERVQQGVVVCEQYEGEDHYFGMYDVSFRRTSDDELAKEAANFVGAIINSAEPLEVNDIKKIERRRDIDSTIRKQLIAARRGQGLFRMGLLERWRGCSVTGCTVNEVLRASHIKPWRSSTDEERLDINNGLLLIATLDALFDKGMISFECDGKMIISPRLYQDQISLVIDREKIRLLQPLTESQKDYLRSHREEVFQNT